MCLRELAAADAFKSRRSGHFDRILLEWEEKWVDKLNGWDLISRCFMFGFISYVFGAICNAWQPVRHLILLGFIIKILIMNWTTERWTNKMKNKKANRFVICTTTKIFKQPKIFQVGFCRPQKIKLTNKLF